MLSIRNFLVPTDFSEQSVAAFHLASALARDHHAALTILHVRETPVVPFAEFGAVPPVDVPSRTALLEKMAEFEPPDDATGVEYLVADGIPAEEIVKVASDRGCDLIVMGTHGRSWLKHRLFGSVTEDVVRRARCPVMVVKAPAAAQELAVSESARRATGD